MRGVGDLGGRRFDYSYHSMIFFSFSSVRRFPSKGCKENRFSDLWASHFRQHVCYNFLAAPPSLSRCFQSSTRASSTKFDGSSS